MHADHIRTDRLDLVPMTPRFLEASLLGDRIEAESAKLRDAGVEFLARQGAGRRHNGDAIAGSESGGKTAAHRNRDISSAIRWWASQPSTCWMRGPWNATGAARNRSLA